MLCAEYRAAVVDHDREPKFVIRLGDGEHFNALFFVFEGDVSAQLVVDARRILLLVSNTFKGIHKVLRAAIHDGNFRTRKLDECVVHFTAV